eukprot:TRINITY_DN7806_c0_g2_i3.p3 TRINITY_DN7806_c0_g2~~TRINITY_DN7806_c0_g2_i3.p3  ORF type:complete len:133 (-),score=33.14 TRINITY_DN7806_c0_g2_i3:53-451(-)
MNVSGGSITSIDLKYFLFYCSASKIAIAMDNNIRLFSYTFAPQIQITDLNTRRAENSHLSPIDYLRATGAPDHFATCVCDESDEVKIWHIVGGSVVLAETQRVGQLGNFGLVSSKPSRLVICLLYTSPSPRD